MTLRPILAAAVASIASACSSGPENHSPLWLYLEGGETDVQLVPTEPAPF